MSSIKEHLSEKQNEQMLDWIRTAYADTSIDEHDRDWDDYVLDYSNFMEAQDKLAEQEWLERVSEDYIFTNTTDDLIQLEESVRQQTVVYSGMQLEFKMAYSYAITLLESRIQLASAIGGFILNNI